MELLLLALRPEIKSSNKEKKEKKEGKKDSSRDKDKEEKEALDVLVIGAGWAGSCIAAALSSPLVPKPRSLNVTLIDMRGMLTDAALLLHGLAGDGEYLKEKDADHDADKDIEGSKDRVKPKVSILSQNRVQLLK